MSTSSALFVTTRSRPISVWHQEVHPGRRAGHLQLPWLQYGGVRPASQRPAGSRQAGCWPAGRQLPAGRCVRLAGQGSRQVRQAGTRAGRASGRATHIKSTSSSTFAQESCLRGRAEPQLETFPLPQPAAAQQPLIISRSSRWSAGIATSTMKGSAAAW